MNLRKIQIILYSGFLFISMQPFFIWGAEWIFILVAFLLAATCLFIKPYTLLDNKIYLFTYFLVCFYLYLMMPFREFDDFTPKHILFMMVLLIGIFWLSNEIIVIWNNLRIIFSIIVLMSLVSILFFYLNVPFPNYELNQDFRLKSTDVYKFYYGMIYLNTQLYNIGGISILRNIGWFGEPGHFGIYLCILLAAERIPWSGRINKILMLGVLTTLSAAAYLVLILIILIKAKKIKFLFYLLLLTPIILLFYYFTDLALVLDFILSKFKDGDEVLESRASLDTSVLYRDNIEIFFGLGNGVLEHYNMFSSDLRAFLVKYGYLSILLFLSSMSPIIWQLFKNNKMKDLGVFLLIILILAIHRSWMLDTFYLWYFMLLILLNSLYVENREISNVK